MEVGSGSLDADFQGLQDGSLVSAFGDDEKDEARWCSYGVAGELLGFVVLQGGREVARGGREGR